MDNDFIQIMGEGTINDDEYAKIEQFSAARTQKLEELYKGVLDVIDPEQHAKGLRKPLFG